MGHLKIKCEDDTWYAHASVVPPETHFCMITVSAIGYAKGEKPPKLNLHQVVAEHLHPGQKVEVLRLGRTTLIVGHEQTIYAFYRILDA